MAEAKVDTASPSYNAMKAKWLLIDDLLGGTLSMRAAGETRLPRELAESTAQYEARLNRSYLYGALKDTVQKLAAKPFSKPVTLGDLPAQLEPLRANVDSNGRDITQFARDVFGASLSHGHSHILVDFPNTGGELTLSEERLRGIRPYLCHIKAEDLIAWKTEPNADGSERLTHIRFKEQRVENDDSQFGEQVVDIIRVFEPLKWEVWKKKEGEYVLADSGVHTFDGVPLVTHYTTRTAFMTSDPPLEDLAWLNLAHWQSLSDQRNILRFARMGILFGKGFTPEEIQAGIVISPSQLTASTNPDADLRYVEHSGAAIGSGEADLLRLEERMEVLGLQPLVQSTGNATATARAMDEARTHSNIQAWIRGLENALEAAFALAGEWMRADIAEDFNVDIFSDFGVSLSATDDVKALIAMRSASLIQHTTFIDEVKRRGILADEIDAEDEVEQLGQEADDALDRENLREEATPNADDD